MRTFGSLRYETDALPYFELVDVEPHVCIRLKALFPKIPLGSSRRFTIAATPAAAVDLEWFMKRYPLRHDEETAARLLEYADAQREQCRKAEEILRPEYTPGQYAISGELRPYQAQGVDFLFAMKRYLCGDDVGLGKTLIAIGAATRPRALPMAVVVQSHLQKQWIDRFYEFIPFGLTVHKVEMMKAEQLPPADVYVFKYNQLIGWVDFFQTEFFKCVVFDEVQEIRRRESQKHQGARSLANASEYVLGLSATPIYNKGPEIFNVIDVISPGALGTWDEFMREWTNGHIVNDPKALGHYLREANLFLRRTREEVGRELPQVNRIVHTVGFDEKKVDSVMELARNLAMTVSTGEFTQRGQAARELDLMLRYVTGVSKAKEVALYVRILLENGEKVLLAGWHREVYDIWLEELKDFNPVMYTGTESGRQKERSKDDFVKGDAQLMIISLRSGAGLDGLQGVCKTVVVGELDWSPEVHKQLEGRLRRDGATDQITAIYLVSDGGSDPVLVDLLGLKASQAKGIVDPFSGIEQVSSDDSRIKQLAAKILNGGADKALKKNT